MKAGVPVATSGDVSVGGRSLSWVSNFTSPKSSTFTKSTVSPMRLVSRFDGLMSRWMMLHACASASDSHACAIRYAARSAGSGPKRVMRSSNEIPSSSSIT